MWVSKDSYSADNDEVTLIKRVEDVVLVHLKDSGYPKGITEIFFICFIYYFEDASRTEKEIEFRVNVVDTNKSRHKGLRLHEILISCGRGANQNGHT